MALARRLSADTSEVASQLRRRLGLSGFRAPAEVETGTDLCQTAGQLIQGWESDATVPQSVVLIRLGPVHIARRDTSAFPVFYLGRRTPFGPPFEVIEVLTVPD